MSKVQTIDASGNTSGTTVLPEACQVSDYLADPNKRLLRLEWVYLHNLLPLEAHQVLPLEVPSLDLPLEAHQALGGTTVVGSTD